MRANTHLPDGGRTTRRICARDKRGRRLGLGLAVATVAGLTASTVAAAEAMWPGSFEGRLAALAIVETLNADLLSHDSATLTLDRWCASHGLAAGAKIVAERMTGMDKPAGPDLRQALAVDPAEQIRYRRVRLRCGERVLSEADNWYVPSRLTPAMNAVLDTTDTAFGRAVADLRFQRHTIAAELLWQPLPKGWEMERLPRFDPSPIAFPDAILQHRAVLTLPNGTPFSEVIETYTGHLFDFPSPVPQ